MPRNVLHISSCYRDLGLTLLHHSFRGVLEQVGNHYEDCEDHVGTRGLLLEYMGDAPNL